MSAVIIEHALEDSIALRSAADAAGLTFAQAKALLAALAAMPREQGDRIVERARAERMRQLNARLRRTRG